MLYSQHPGISAGECWGWEAKNSFGKLMYTLVVLILALSSLVGAWGLLKEAFREAH